MFVALHRLTPVLPRPHHFYHSRSLQTCLPRAPANISWSFVGSYWLIWMSCLHLLALVDRTRVTYLSGNSFWSSGLESEVKFVLRNKVEVLMSKLEEMVRMAKSQRVTLTLTMSFLSPMLTWGPLEHLVRGAYKGEYLPGDYLGSGPSFATD